jgi:hypothetical protein
VFGRRLSHAGHSHHAGHPHPLRRRIVLTIVAAALLALLALLIAPPHAHGNFVFLVDFLPAGLVGVPNSEPLTITLAKQRKRK